MFFTGYLSRTRSYFVSLPWPGGTFWALFVPTSEIFAISLLGTRGCSSLRSMEQGWVVLFVPFARTSTHQTRALSVVGCSVWYGLIFAVRLLPRVRSASE